MIVDQPRIKELDINPFFATRNSFVALDTRVVLHPFEIADECATETGDSAVPVAVCRDVYLA